MSTENLIPDFDLEDEIEEQEVDSPEETPEQEEEILEGDPNAIAVYQLYKDKGLLTVEDPFDGKFETLETLLEKQRATEQENLFSQLVGMAPQWASPLVEVLLNEGENLDKEAFQKLFDIAQPVEYDQESLKEEVNAEKFLKDYYMNVLGDEEEDAEDKIDLLRDKNKLSREAQNIFKVDYGNRQKTIDKAVEDSRENKIIREQQVQQYLNTFHTGVKDLGWQQNRQNIVEQEFSEGMFKQRLDHLLTNPKLLPHLIDFMSYYDGEKFDLEAYKKEAFTPSARKVKENIKNYWGSQSFRSSEIPKSANNDLDNFELDI
jgi:hypothetical protein